MARDEGLEALLSDDLSDLEALRQQKMFGGICWLWQGNLLCCAGKEGILFRLGKGNDGWALAEPAVSAMIMGGRPMEGWVRLSAEAAGDDALRARLMAAARAFVATLPPK